MEVRCRRTVSTCFCWPHSAMFTSELVLPLEPKAQWVEGFLVPNVTCNWGSYRQDLIEKVAWHEPSLLQVEMVSLVQELGEGNTS